MKVSLNWVKKYVDLPSDVTEKQIAYNIATRHSLPFGVGITL